MSLNSCDKCGRERSTLYEGGDEVLRCYYCLPVENLSGEDALRTIRKSVTGAAGVERRRRALQKRKATK